MKKILFIAFIPCVLFVYRTQAQKQVSDAQITYRIKVDLPEGVPAPAAAQFENSHLVYSFKNYLFRSDMYIGQKTRSNIRNSRDHTAVTLIDNGQVKYLIRFDPQELARESKRFEGVTFRDGTGTRKIAGYQCREATGQLKDGTTFSLYYTPELVTEDQDYNDRFRGLKGIPLEFEMTTSHHVTMTMTATEVSLTPQPRSVFAIPTSGYREISYSELQRLRAQH